MPCRALIIIVFLIIAWFSPVTAASLQKIKTRQQQVVIDPGHGGRDSGITSSVLTLEKQITLMLSKRVAEYLDGGYNVLLTREKDETLTPGQRVTTANALNADLFVSIHLAGPGSKAGGFYYYHLPDADAGRPDQEDWKTISLAHSAKSRSLAKILSRFCASDSSTIIRDVQAAPLLTLQGADMPGVLIEPVPISHLPADPKDLETALDELAKKIGQGIDLFLKETAN